MRVQNETVDNPFSSRRSDAAQGAGVESRSGSKAVSGGSADRVSLSKASSLVSLAKQSIPADKKAKFEAVSNQVSTGQYKLDAPGVSQAIVQGHMQK